MSFTGLWFHSHPHRKCGWNVCTTMERSNGWHRKWMRIKRKREELWWDRKNVKIREFHAKEKKKRVKRLVVHWFSFASIKLCITISTQIQIASGWATRKMPTENVLMMLLVALQMRCASLRSDFCFLLMLSFDIVVIS